MRRVYSLGYGLWKNLKEFTALLTGLEVRVLVNVRRFAQSKNPSLEWRASKSD